MIRRFIVLTAASLALLPCPGLGAQERGAVEFGPVARYTVYDAGVGFDGAGGLGGRLGVFLSPVLVVEFEGAYARPRVTDATESVTHELYQARVVFLHWLGEQAALLLGGGVAFDHYSGASRTAGARGGGPGALMGLRYEIRDGTFLRVDGSGYLVPPNEDALPIARVQTLNLGIAFALSILLAPPAGQ
jgi:hypothetical protein